MNNKNNIHTDDELIRQMMQSAKKQAPENLKYRIMQQIETESALTRKPVSASKREGFVLKDFIGIFSTMYIVLGIFIVGSILLKGKAVLTSSGFIWMIVLISSVFSLFWLMTRVDERLREKRRKTHSTSHSK